MPRPPLTQHHPPLGPAPTQVLLGFGTDGPIYGASLSSPSHQQVQDAALRSGHPKATRWTRDPSAYTLVAEGCALRDGHRMWCLAPAGSQDLGVLISEDLASGELTVLSNGAPGA